MKVLTLHEPYASLVAQGRKTIETRDWPPPAAMVGGRIGVHAAKVFGKDQQMRMRAFKMRGTLNLGCILCTVRIAGVFRVLATDSDTRRIASVEAIGGECPHWARIPADEYRFGDLSDGRYGWVLDDVQPIDPPIHARGYQKLWEYEP